MSSDELKELAGILSAIADGASWECQWAGGEWAGHGGRDVEYCIANRIAIRLTGEQPKPLINTGGPAFPQPFALTSSGDANIASEFYHNADGMTLRDWFAGKALPGFIINPSALVLLEVEGCSASKGAYQMADAMIAERDRNDGANRNDRADIVEALLAVVKLIPESIHPANPNDDGRPCICSHCELVQAANSAIALAEGGGK